MREKYKITNVSETTNDLERQRAKDCKQFNRKLIQLAVSSGTTVISGFMMEAGDYASIGAAFGVAVMAISLFSQFEAVMKLQNLYNKRYDEQGIEEENNVGGKTR